MAGMAGYAGLVGRFHLWKESAKERWRNLKGEGELEETLKKRADGIKEDVIKKINHGDEEYDHLFRYSMSHFQYFIFLDGSGMLRLERAYNGFYVNPRVYDFRRIFLQ